MKYLWIIFAMILLVGCTATEPSGTVEITDDGDDVKLLEPVKLGFIGPLTGEAANYGIGAVAAVELAVQEINDAGGINGRPLEIVFEDTVCDGAKASIAVNKLINIDKVPVIVGGPLQCCTTGSCSDS